MDIELQEVDRLQIPIDTRYGEVTLDIEPSSPKAGSDPSATYNKLYVTKAPYPGEAKHQLVEGSTYHYEFGHIGNHQFQFSQESDVIRFLTFAQHRDMGDINTGINVGQLVLTVVELTTREEVGKVRLEVRSVKSDYETDYHQMLDDIAKYYSDLVLLQGSTAKQMLQVDDNCKSNTLYQKFSYVRSVVDSEVFQEAIRKIMANPVRKWTEATVERDIISVRHLSRRNIRQMATSHDRMVLPEQLRHGLPACLTSVPRHLEVDYKRDTIDNQENQFVKMVLQNYQAFCLDLRGKKNATVRLKEEIDQTTSHIFSYLNSQFFRQVSLPTHLNMNSPVLQRKEGYREVLQSWLMFDLAGKLNWEGGDNVYEAGKKNVATLYEYWLFFKLQEIISDFFQLKAEDKEKLIQKDKDSINLNLRQGKMQVIHGVSTSSIRNLKVAFYYNRTFSKVYEKDNKEGKTDDLTKAGSWTIPMRPDYTLSIWPGDISEEEAEREDVITHIHFDAKYRLNKVLLEDDATDEKLEEELNEEKDQQELGIYKRADLLKMHAYKDAIRRTSGAYVLYPGTENRYIKGFHEIIPGLGAFCIRPGRWQEDAMALKEFLAEVKAHMFDRTSQREKMSFYDFDTHKEPNAVMVMESMPESVGENRSFLPDETSVLIGYYNSEEHLDWILEQHKYNVRAGDDNGSLPLGDDLINARYLLLHDRKQCYHLIKIRKTGPKVFTRAQLIKKNYPPYMKSHIVDGMQYYERDEVTENQERDRIYLVFDLYKDNKAEKEFLNYTWRLQDLIPNHGKFLHFPITMKLSDLMSKARRI